jgi:hypothetical protein
MELDELITTVQELATARHTAGLPLGLTTSQAAGLLGRKPKTLRKWSSEGSGPMTPCKCHGRLIWPLASVEKLLRGEGQNCISKDPAAGQPDKEQPNDEGEPVARSPLVFPTAVGGAA